MNDGNYGVLQAIVMEKFNCSVRTAKSFTKHLVEVDFPKNKITTFGQALAYLDWLGNALVLKNETDK